MGLQFPFQHKVILSTAVVLITGGACSVVILCHFRLSHFHINFLGTIIELFPSRTRIHFSIERRTCVRNNVYSITISQKYSDHVMVASIVLPNQSIPSSPAVYFDPSQVSHVEPCICSLHNTYNLQSDLPNLIWGLSAREI